MVSITKEQEKSLLITLSQIKLWISEFDSESDNHGNPLIAISNNTKSTTHVSICHSSPSECILKITNDLVFMLAFQNPYAQHLAGNVLVAISEIITSSENYWEEFIQSLCSHLNLIIHKAISPSSNPPKTKHLDLDSSTLKLHLQSASAIILVLRNVLKQLKHEEDDEILEVYLNTLGSCIRDIPWESCNGISMEFCGHLLQLFCSVVSQSSLLESMADFEEKNSVFYEIFNIFPKLLTLGIVKDGDNCITEYIQHKILVLMIRLSSLINLDCQMIISWLHLINQHFQHLLHESLTQNNTNQDDSLKDSPFLMFLDDKEKKTSHQHLQRRVVFLYLLCTFHLIKPKEKSINQCVCGDVKKSCSKKGFLAIHDWLKKHIEFDFNKSKQFAKSFVQLYIHEDDMLFKVLLLVTNMPNGINEDWRIEVIHYDHEGYVRCLRIICDKWNTFLKFTFHEEVGSQYYYKRRKVMKPKLSLENTKNEKTSKQPFDDARECLLSLKRSVESLHQKDLFPYNPKVLLRR
ncbi:hypothetical protein L2E82_44044 [Cichorium intybus]|uniref:Uncharacterized protein n=1 Tax=Cichorium intybus TaxID=13427 RepID=A0ACB8ZPP5_CICIN|nr:hypothetical protein L2E82_44044 [Cichorium intybus]